MRRAFLLAAAAFATPALAQETRLDTLERQLAEQQQRIHQLEALVARQAALLERLDGARTAAASSASPPQQAAVAPVSTAVSGVPMPVPAVAGAPQTPFRIPGLDVSGDLRVRQEWNFGAARDRSRSALRARLRASYAADDHLAIGAQLATGDPDDPNSTDVTLGNFLDDLTVSLDQAWLRYSQGGLVVIAGKFPQIFQRTDMIWDGDVSPEGIGVNQSIQFGHGERLDARALWFVIDEAPVARDSDMLGGQLAAAVPLAPQLRFTATGSYFHYRLGSVAGADTGDFRGNLVANGRYRSTFRLAEALGTLSYEGLSPRWPLVFTADYVKNFGAVAGSTGFSLELAAGRTLEPGDWRVTYGYSQVGVDAVFAAFSHDNLDLSTNYRLHSLTLAHVPGPHLLLDLAWFHYRPLDPAYATIAPADWLDRIRLNLMVSF